MLLDFPVRYYFELDPRCISYLNELFRFVWILCVFITILYLPVGCVCGYTTTYPLVWILFENTWFWRGDWVIKTIKYFYYCPVTARLGYVGRNIYSLDIMNNIEPGVYGWTAESMTSGSAKHLVCLGSQQSQLQTPLISSTLASGEALNGEAEFAHYSPGGKPKHFFKAPETASKQWFRDFFQSGKV